MPNTLQKKSSTEVPDVDKKSAVNVDPRYQELLDANPYRNYDYKESGWQKFLSGLGFRTKADAYREQMSLNAAEYDSQVLQKNMDESYESPTEMAARERAAGINPDLAGLDAAGASPMREDTNNPTPPTDDLSDIAEFGNQLMSVFSTAVGIAGDVGSVNSVLLGNEKQRLQNASDYFRLAQDVLVQSSSRLPYGAGVNVDWHNVDQLGASVFGWRSRKHRKFNDVVRGVFDSMPTEKAQMDAWLGLTGSRSSAFGAANSTSYSDSNAVLQAIAKNLGKFDFDKFYDTKYAEREEAGNRADYAEGFDASLKAETENLGNQVQQVEGENKVFRSGLINEFNKTYKSMLKDVEDLSNRGNVVASCFLALINVLRLQMLKI